MSRYISVNRIEFAITYLCNSRCRHCQLGEEEERRKFGDHIDKKTAVEIVRKVGTRYSPSSVMTFGGEPLLHPEIVYAIHKEAARMGIPSREVITNGFWSANPKEIEEIGHNLVKSGVNEVHISVDCFHQEFIPLGVVRKAAESLLEAGIARILWNPCWVVSRNQDNVYVQRTEALLEELKDLPVKANDGNVVQPEGRAASWLEDFLPPRERIPKGRCGDMPYTEPLDSIRTICVEPDGRIAICKRFYIGNAFENDILEIIEDFDPFKIPEAKAMIENGMKGLRNWARTKGVHPGRDGYYNICQMCMDIRTRARSITRTTD